MPTLVPSEAIPEHNSYDGSEDAYRDENGMPLSPNWFWYGATDVEKEACASDQQASVPFSQSSFQRPRRIFRRSTDTRGQDVESDPSAAVDSAQFDSKQIRAVVLEEEFHMVLMEERRILRPPKSKGRSQPPTSESAPLQLLGWGQGEEQQPNSSGSGPAQQPNSSESGLLSFGWGQESGADVHETGNDTDGEKGAAENDDPSFWDVTVEAWNDLWKKGPATQHHRGKLKKPASLPAKKTLRHLVRCRFTPTELVYWKTHLSQASSDAEGNANVLLKNQMSGAVELLGTSEVEVVRGGMQLRIRTPRFSSDRTDVAVEEHVFMSAAPHIQPQKDLHVVCERVKEIIAANNDPNLKPMVYRSDPRKSNFASLPASQPLSSGPRLPEGYDDALLLDGFIPDTHEKSANSAPRGLSSEATAISAKFQDTKRRLAQSLHVLGRTEPGSAETLRALGVEPQAALALVAVGPQEDGERGAEWMENLDGADWDGSAAEVWDVEQSELYVALRHVSWGICVILPVSGEDAPVAVVTSSGKEFVFTADDELEEQELDPEQREATMLFADRLLPEALDRLEFDDDDADAGHAQGGWVVQHEWRERKTMGQWFLTQRDHGRCVAVRQSDPGGGLHFLPNGVVCIGKARAMMHLQTQFGPVGPETVSFQQAVRPFPDQAGNDAANQLTIWQPTSLSGGKNKVNGTSLKHVYICAGETIDPIHVTCAGLPPINFSVHPPLPHGLSLVPVDEYSATISGAAEMDAQELNLTIKGTNRLGSTSNTIKFLVQQPPRKLTYEPEAVVCGVGKPILSEPATLRGSSPFIFTISGALPKGVRLDRYSGRLCGTMTEMADPVFGRQKEVWYEITATNGVGSTQCAIMLRHLPEALAVAVMDGATRMPRRMAEMGGAPPKKASSKPKESKMKVQAPGALPGSELQPDLRPL